MTNWLRFENKWVTSVLAAAALLASSSALAQAPPDQPPPPPPGMGGQEPVPEVTPLPPQAVPAVEAKPVSYPAMGKNKEIMLGPDTWIRWGLQAQIWMDFNQGTTKKANGDDADYSMNILARRIRAIFGGQPFKNFNMWFQFDMARAGQATGACTTAGTPPVTTCTSTKTFSPAILQDAWGELKIAGDQFMLEAGLMIVPFSRNVLQSTTTFWTLDAANTSNLFAGPTATSATRDTGFQFKGYVLEDKLEYRVGLFSGIRQPQDATSGAGLGRNFFLISAYLQYNIFDVEKSYVFAGQNFGKKQILGLSVGFEEQKTDGANDP
jgi:hypothetical protein